MGYFKNELISHQVEVGDRVPAPKPASEHIALQHDETTKIIRTIAGVVIGWILVGIALTLAVVWMVTS